MWVVDGWVDGVMSKVVLGWVGERGSGGGPGAGWGSGQVWVAKGHMRFWVGQHWVDSR